MPIVKPILKWVGGKSQIIEEVLHLFPKEIKNYYEPFLGGGSVLFGLLSLIQEGKIVLRGKIYASDLNPHLIHLYTNVRQSPDQIIEEVRQIMNEYTALTGTTILRKPTSKAEALTSQESYYFWIRIQFNALSNEEKASPKASAMLLFLNKTCFRGLYREGPNGFNVPFGHYKNPSILDEGHIRAVAQLLKDVIFIHASFTEAFSKVQDGDFIYLDPPYAPENETSFVGYTGDGFNLEHHTQLFNLCDGLRAKGVRFLMSNADVPLVRNAFPEPTYTTKTILCRRAIHSKKPDSKTNEVLVMNQDNS